MNQDGKSLEFGIKELSKQYTQLREEYAKIVEEYVSQLHTIDKLMHENKDLQKKLEFLSGKDAIISNLALENADLRLKLQNYNELKEINDDLNQKLEEATQLLQKQEVRRSSNEYLNEFAKNFYAKRPRVLNSLSLFSPHNVMSERYEVDMSTECPTESRTTGKTPQANPDQSLVCDSVELKLFESFFLLGVSRENIGKIGCLPEVLFEYSAENVHPCNKKILTDFCFPTQFQCKAVRESKSDAEISSILFGQELEVRSSNCFIFTLKSQDSYDWLIEYEELPNAERELLYCICVQVEDISNDLATDVEYINTKCLCLLSYIPVFDMHFKLLTALLQLRKIWKMEVLTEYESFRVSLKKATEEVPPIWKDILGKYAKSEKVSPGLKIVIEEPLIHTIEYTFCNDLSMIDIEWVVSSLVSLLDPQDFLWLLAALVQEKSIVFVSYNLDLLTTCVLAMQALLRPFKWPNLSISLIPDSLRELLEAPIPILAGLPGTAPESRKNMTNLIWVFLDEPKMKKRLFYSNAILQEVQEIPDSLISQEIFAVYANEGKEIQLASLVKKIWTNIIDKFKGHVFPDLETLQSHVINSYSGCEKAFLNSLMQTQLFINLVEGIFD